MQNMQDCGFTRENKWFRYRAAAIIIEEDCALFAGNEIDNYYYSIGGGVHVGETSEKAVKREVLEETGVEYEIERLAVKPRGTKQLNSDSYSQGVRETMHWIPIKDLDKYKAFPSFLKEYFSKEHSGIEHIITDERK